jgi:hypothetical protein
VRFTRAEGQFCRSCGISVYRDLTTKTLWQGWWGLLLLVVTPLTLISNFKARAKFCELPAPAGGWRPPLDPGKPVLRRAGALGLLAPLLIVGLVAFGVATYH